MIEISAAFSFSLPKLLLAGALLFFLYAETHYHFRFAPSLLYRRRPEIIADAPHRLEPGKALPVLLIIKDAHRFPVALQQVRAEISCRRPVEHSFRFSKTSRADFRLQDAPEALPRRCGGAFILWSFPLNLPVCWG
jgi:hypothetical protein